ncbi:MAG: SUMF1/EgtB/PvdO family nonheme iron enzyme [Planctomycetota bacterium]|nr:SUMF1/EgtB/PvdO family nonheme iron enzyme [Planctomycetota bacterium]
MADDDFTLSNGDFAEIEAELSRVFTEKREREVWGDTLSGTASGMTVKREPYPEPSKPTISIDAGAGDSRATVSRTFESTVMLTRHGDGSASMTMPGASVTLSPKRTALKGGGDYEIGEVVGRGGMGVVNVARQASLDRRIVIKRIRPDLAGRVEAQEKFITEALATGALDHPNVVPIHDMGVAEDGLPFYVMKEVRGRNWREFMPGLELSENIDILQRVADAVACAHAKGIVHRDLKPENIMIGDYGEVLLMDWGLAVGVAPNAKASPLTPANACAGTPTYMAPEMARGLAHEIGPWSDQYLLGGLLFAVLTGKAPHPGKDAAEAVRNAGNNVLQEVERADEWINVAYRALSASPAKRYPSVKAFQRALRECQVHAESIKLSGEGDDYLAQAGETGSYGDFSRAVFAFEQALALWGKNAEAKARLDDARIAYAEKAVANGDCDLTLSVLSVSSDERAKPLADRALKERSERNARRRLVRILGLVAVLALALVAGVAGVAAWIVSRQAEAERLARREAEEQRLIAESERREADEARGVAEERRREADIQRGKAERALAAEAEARRSEAEAQASRLHEQEAKLAAEEKARIEAENARQRAEEALRAREEIQRLGYLEDNTRWRFDPGEAVRRQQDAAERLGLPVERTATHGGAEFAMALVPPGEYVMGSPPRDSARNNDEYLHEVALTRALYFFGTEITRGQWRAVVGTETRESLGRAMSEDELATRAWRMRGSDDDDFPATGISVEDIESLFLPALNRAVEGGAYRLPSEAEWEWAARAGAVGHFYNGDAADDLDVAGWYERNSAGHPHRVARKEPNAWGLHDMLGNVAEVTMDAYDALYYLRAPRTDPVNPGAGERLRVCRGGSYIHSPRQCRLSTRSSIHEVNRYPHAGFRPVFEPDLD